MIAKTRALVVRNINFKDNSVISHMYTREFGSQSFMLHGVRNQKGNVRPSHIMPLSLVELVIYKKENSNIQQIKELRCNPSLATIHFDIVKNSVALFVAEIINSTINEEEENQDLFEFLEQFVQILDLETEGVGNYPIYFLAHLSRFLGFYPKGQFAQNQVFNLNEGLFIDEGFGLSNSLSFEMSQCLWKLLNTTFESLTDLRISKSMRTDLLDNLLLYYEIHGLHGRKIKSHKILREVLR